MTKEFSRLIRPLLVLFIMINALLLVFQTRLESKKINVDVVIIANILLFLVSIANIYFQMKSLRNPNLSPGTVIRGLMAGTFLKLMMLAATVIIYLVAAGANRSVNAVFVGMGLYIIYTWLEVKISLRLNPKK